MADAVRAAVLVAPGQYEVQEFPRPSLADGALLMQVEMSGICGTDKHTFMGETKQYAGTPAETDTPFPIIQGHENVGVIAEISPTAAERIEFYGRRLAVGDRITMCPDVVCGRCYPCTHVMGYVWCDNSQCYGNSFTSASRRTCSAAGPNTCTCDRTHSCTRSRADCHLAWPSWRS